jgi:hypothetical protein
MIARLTMIDDRIGSTEARTGVKSTAGREKEDRQHGSDRDCRAPLGTRRRELAEYAADWVGAGTGPFGAVLSSSCACFSDKILVSALQLP